MDEPSTTYIPDASDHTCLDSPDPQNNISVKQSMSASLRDRLRKMRRSFSSPCSVAKRLKVDCEESEESESLSQCAGDPSPAEKAQGSTVSLAQACTSTSNANSSEPPVEVSSPTTPSYASQQDLLQEKRRLLKQVEDKEEVLRRLKMVKLYRSKNNLMELQSLIEKWRKSSQLMIFELQNALNTENTKVSLTHLIDSYGLDGKLLHYNRTEEDFDEP
ncbi:swi5-dependent recombination DNA repair protein 1 homolog [Hyperolius riggenbachi]|uniref:swi5-dependent recombination DNA repair protein 1 homolog n=1 Tax=Hyperolius riggenbachi TaxID=752182 RepID=UPI0035A34ED3